MPDLDEVTRETPREKKKREREEKKAAKAAEKERVKSEKQLKKEDEAEKKMKPWKKILLIIGLSIVGIILLVYLIGVIFFTGHFGFGSRINGTDCSFKSAAQVEKIIQSQVESYTITLKERKGAKETISGTDVDLTYVEDGQVKALLKKQNAWIWPYRFLIRDRITDTETHASVTLNEDKFTEVVNSLTCMDTSQMIAPADAYPELSGSTYSVHAEEEGTTLDTDVFTSKLKEAILATEDVFDLDADGCYINPTLTSDSQELLDIVEKYNEYVSLSITYQFPDGTTEVLDGTTTNAWLTWDADYKATVNTDSIAAWVTEFAARHNTVGTTRTFTTATGGTAEVSGGTYGWTIDQEQEKAYIAQMFSDMQSQSREPAWSQRGASYGSFDFGSTFIEVNLSTQHMWYVQDGTSVFESDVVTGLPTAKRQTPAGVYSVLEMKQNKVLRGEKKPDGTYEYETPVAYWIRVTWTGVGFHDATWQSSFGGNRYTYAGSHGCINMPYSAVQQLYSLVSVGTPIVIHY